MIVAAIVFLCGIVHIMGRPHIGSNELNNLEQIPSWPQLNNSYLLPKKLRVDDIINITAEIINTPMLNISFFAETSASNDSSKVLTFVANTSTGLVNILDEKGDPFTDMEEDISNFYLNEEGTIFNVWFRRREIESTQKTDYLEIRSNSFSKLLHIPEVNDIRFLRFTGENVKVTELEFKYSMT